MATGDNSTPKVAGRYWSPDALGGKVAIVTGASGGIGKATAQALAEVGATVYALTRDPDSLDVPAVRALRADAGDAEELEAAVTRIHEESGGPHIVVANAARGASGAMAESTPDDWTSEFHVNVVGAMAVFQAALRHMVPGGEGSLIAVGSSAGARGGQKGHVAYGATKAALVGLMKGLAREVGHHGIRANVVAPGATEGTALSDAIRELQGDAFGRAAFLDRAGRLDEVANAIIFLASDASSYTTGSVLRVDGGSVYRDTK